MGVTKSADFDDFIDDDLEQDDFAYIEDAAERRRPQQQKARKSNKASWRSVEDYLESRQLKDQLSDVFDDD